MRRHRRAKSEFYWAGMRSDIKKLLRECDSCQRTKISTHKSYGLLQPLPIPNQPWTNVFMDFIKGLSPSSGYNTILVVVDRLSQYAHFFECGSSIHWLKYCPDFYG